MKLVILNGSSCSGKSTIVKDILKEKERYFHLSYDSVKWLISKYEAQKYYPDVHKILASIASTVCGLKYNIVTDSALHRATRERLCVLAKEHSYEMLEINLEADYQVLVKRFDERVASALRSPERRISNLSKERFKELFDIYESEKNTSAVTFRTDTQTVAEVSKSVMNLL